MLAPLVRSGLSSWDDTHIQPGQHRQQAIQDAIAGARVAVLLVSAEFLNSDFLGQELSEMLAVSHRDTGLRILWVAVRPCLWQETVLTTYEPVHDPGSPLSTLVDADTALAQICTRIKDAIERASPSDGGVPNRNPYRGLSFFECEESHIFFGREDVTHQLCKDFQRLMSKPGATRLLAILGPSGSGKSSLARAGLLAALQRSSATGAQSLRTAILRPGSRPIESLARALSPLLPPETTLLPASRTLAIEQLLRSSAAPAQGLRRFADDLPQIGRCPLLLLVDQFEEIYTLCADKEERDAFVSLLLYAASDSARHVAVVLTLRSDFLGETQRYHSSLNRLIAAQAVIVPAMSSEELREAIVHPAEQAGRPMDQTTVELLLTEANGSQGALPLLQFALTRIWEGMERGVEPGVTLRNLGGVGGALAGEAQKIYNSLAPGEQATVRRALVRLVELGEGTRDTRRRAPVRELVGRGETSDTVLSVLRRFSTEGARLVTLSGDGAEAVAEVTHEALFEHWTDLHNWIDECRADRRFHDRVAEAAHLWHEAGRPSGRLWRPPDLDLLRDYQQRSPDELSLRLEAFLSAALHRQRQEKLFTLGSVVAIFASVLIAITVYVAIDRQRIRQVHEIRLDSYVERGRQRLFEYGNPIEGLLWLHRAQGEGSKDPVLPDLLRSALQGVYTSRAVLTGHLDSVSSAELSPDGRRIVTASEDHTARVWETEGGLLLAELKGHKDSVNCALFSPDSHRIITGSEDHTARIWEAEGGHLVAELKGHESSVLSVAFSPSGRRIVTASKDRTARIWQADDGRLIAELKGHTGRVLSAKFSTDGRRIVTASWDGTARVWDSEGGRLIAELKGHTDRVLSAKFSPDGRRIVTASRDHTGRVWDSEGGRLLAELKGHGSIVWSAEFSPDGRRIVTAGWDSMAMVWEAESGRLLAELRGHKTNVVNAIYSPDGQRIVTTSWDRTGRVWAAESGWLLATLEGHAGSVDSATFSADGRRIVTASRDRTARVWEDEGGRLLAELKGPRTSVRMVTLSPDEHHAVIASGDSTARVWEAESGRLLVERKAPQAGVDSATFSFDGRRIVTARASETARVWDAESGQLLAELSGYRDAVHSATFSADGRLLVTVRVDHKAQVWEVESGRLLADLKDHGPDVCAATFSPDGHRLVTTSSDNTARIWTAESGRLLLELKGSGDPVHSATFSPNGRFIVTASRDYTARVWDAEGGRLIAELKGHEADINSATFSPDGYRVATASNDHTARVWEARSGRLLVELKGHESSVVSATFSPDGNRIVTTSVDRTAKFWEVQSGRLLADLRGHGSGVVNATFSPDGRRIVTASEDGTARVWDLSPEPRTYWQLAKLIRCSVPAHIEPEGGNIIIFRMPTPDDCQK